jgi:hypothetical protein
MGEKVNKQLDDGQLLLTVTVKRQARPLVSEGVPQKQDSKFQTVAKPHSELDTKTY